MGGAFLSGVVLPVSALVLHLHTGQRHAVSGVDLIGDSKS